MPNTPPLQLQPTWPSKPWGQRVGMGLLIAGVFLPCLFLGKGWWLALVTLALTLAFYECVHLLHRTGGRVFKSAYLITVVPLLLAISAERMDLLGTLLAMGVLVTFVMALFKQPEVGVKDIGATLYAIMYTGFFPLHIIALRWVTTASLTATTWWGSPIFRYEGMLWTMMLLLVVALTDIGAYVVGKAKGKRLLWPRVSPKKTVEGAVGGALWGMTMATLWGWLTPLPLHHCMVLGALLVCVALLGDLVESKLKREAGVKDSGFLLESHGGVLDRIDSYLLSVAVAYYYVHWCVHKQGLLPNLMDWVKPWLQW